MIIECVGLPGAGKTTICKAVSVPHGTKGDVPLYALRPDPPFLRAAGQIMLLCATARPFSFNRVKRGFNLMVFLRHYDRRGLTILLDQGIVQKLWSILADATFHSDDLLARLMTSLRPFAADCMVWIETPPGLAAQRMAVRGHGNSRYDGMPVGAAEAQLAVRVGLLDRIVMDFHKATGIRLLKLDGQAAPVTNAERIGALLR